ncbi:helix-turn-helix transcriptional regulator [Actinokineospora inagensis]|uniref:helix-turn-helix transcriptional regulator n=1 Tax=Actinokineospora inagensis TaxID=103730 RepID=UPI000A067D03|nr:helix-turn-helix transcriptional regulator [Actinokineospora inagensis]
MELVAARRAAGFSQESLAEALGVDRTTVMTWEAGTHAPTLHVRPRLAWVLKRSTEQLEELLGERSRAVAFERPDLDPALAWLDRHAGWASGTARQRVGEGLARPVPAAAVGRRHLADALANYYGGANQYAAQFGSADVLTSVFTRADWLDLGCALSPTGDALMTSAGASANTEFDEYAAGVATRKLIEAVTKGTRLTDAPVYRLVDISPSTVAIRGRFEVASFLDYALTVDLLEQELLDVLTGRTTNLPLRDARMPTLESVVDLPNRLCGGGVLALFAVARPADPYRGAADYVLLVQERSKQVVNAAGRLAVIPKGFHGPLNDVRADCRIGATLRRELEEELFGRADVDITGGPVRAAEPMHRTRLSEPMRWLLAEPGRLRMECTAFGLNLVSGNYEFACLIVIEDEEFWERFGGHIEANWESAGLRQYSSRDGDSLEELIADNSWSNEGLFAMLQGVRRLAEIGGNRVRLPPVEWRVG